jgi:histidinol-phosphate aminotransferase
MSIAAKLGRPDILALTPYSHAAWDPSLERLHANENPWRARADKSDAGLNRYPEPDPITLESRLATLYGVMPNQLLVGRGLDEGIDLLMRAFLVPGQDAMVQCPPTFGMYAVAAKIQGAEIINVPLTADGMFALNVNGLLAACSARTKLVMLCSPNNPTGNVIPRDQIRALARQLDHQALLVVDEAYIEFSDTPSLLDCLTEHPNVVILRTLSKAYGLAGARCGTVLASPDIIDLLRRIRPPYAMATPVTEAILCALSADALREAKTQVSLLISERTRLQHALAAIPLITRVYPSEANFLMVACQSTDTLMARAKRAGFLLRDVSHHPQTRACVRITIGTSAQNDRLLEGLSIP